MNQHPCCCTVFISTTTPQEALLCRYGRQKEDTGSISVKTAPYRPPGTSSGASRYKSTPQTQSPSQGSAYSQSLSKHSREEVVKNKNNRFNGTGYPQVPAGGILRAAVGPLWITRRRSDMKGGMRDRVDQYDPLSVDIKLPP